MIFEHKNLVGEANHISEHVLDQFWHQNETKKRPKKSSKRDQKESRFEALQISPIRAQRRTTGRSEPTEPDRAPTGQKASPKRDQKRGQKRSKKLQKP